MVCHVPPTGGDAGPTSGLGMGTDPPTIPELPDKGKLPHLGQGGGGKPAGLPG
jgi:hypothetical protein